jgi:hypothetical protein
MPSKLETAPFHILTKNETPKLRAPPNLRREVNEAHSIQVTRETANKLILYLVIIPLRH